MRIEPPVSRFSGGQVLVFHFPGMVQGVKSGVPNQEPAQLAFQFVSRHSLLVDARKRERDAPEVR